MIRVCGTCSQYRFLQAAEAMGAISAEASIPVLQRYANDANRSVRETVEIALDKIKWDHSEEGRIHREELQKAREEYVSSPCRDIPSPELHLVESTLPLTQHHRRLD